jgi:hypothetical protein
VGIASAIGAEDCGFESRKCVRLKGLYKYIAMHVTRIVIACTYVCITYLSEKIEIFLNKNIIVEHTFLK